MTINDDDIKMFGIRLKTIFFNDEYRSTLDDDDNTTMYLFADGNGLSGNYDRIHVYGRKRMIFNAHAVEGFEPMLEGDS